MLSTPRLPKIRHRTQLGINRSSSIPPRIQRLNRLLRLILIIIPRIHIPIQMITQVLAHMHLLYFPELTQFAEEVLVEGVKMLFYLGGSETGGLLVYVSAEDCLGVVWLDVFSGAGVAVATGADFEVEGTVYFVGFCAVDGREMGGHR